MSESTSACARGCGIKNRHLADCDGYTPSEKPCPGCLPRRAEFGRLCWPCHHRLKLLVTDAAVLDNWLSGNMTAGEGAAKAKQDFEQIHGDGDGSPTPLKVEVYVARQELRDHWAEWVEWLCERENLHGPDHHTAEADSTYLLTWLDRIEGWDTIAELYDQTAWLVSCAHALAPWRPEAKRVPKLACPECGEVHLMIYGGDSHVTCGSCAAVILAEHLGLWEQIAKEAS